MAVHDETPEAAGGTGRRWRARPRLAVLVRSTAYAAPFVAALLAGIAIAVALPTPRTMGDLIFSWVAVLLVSTIVASWVTRLARRLLPLAALLKMTMAFPDKTPSRFSVALRSGSMRTMKKRTLELERGTTDRARAAETVLMLVAALSDHDRKTRGHSERVRAYSELIAEELHIHGRDLDKLRWASLLHDVGKMAVPPSVLNGDSKLTDDEWEVIKRHPVEGAKLAAPLAAWLGPWAETVLHHHERWDGTGYPDGVAGDKIGLGARIVSVADAFEVMTAGRTYQKAMSLQEAREQLTRNAGSQFDPTVVRAFLNCSLGRVATVAGPLAWIGQTPVLARLAAAVGTPTQVVLAASVAVVGATAIGALPDVLAPPPAGTLVAAPPPPMRVLERAPSLPPFEPALQSGPADAATATAASPVGAEPAPVDPAAPATEPEPAPAQPPAPVPAPAPLPPFEPPAPPPGEPPPPDEPPPNEPPPDEPPDEPSPTVEVDVEVAPPPQDEPPPPDDPPPPEPDPLIHVSVGVEQPVPVNAELSAVPGAAAELAVGPLQPAANR